jgi:hypothetical protein
VLWGVRRAGRAKARKVQQTRGRRIRRRCSARAVSVVLEHWARVGILLQALQRTAQRVRCGGAGMPRTQWHIA